MDMERPPLGVFGVGHDASIACSRRLEHPPFALRAAKSPLAQSVASNACGVGHEEESLSDVRRANGTSRYTSRPDGVANRLHVIRHNVEPRSAKFRFRLRWSLSVRSIDACLIGYFFSRNAAAIRITISRPQLFAITFRA